MTPDSIIDTDFDVFESVLLETIEIYGPFPSTLTLRKALPSAHRNVAKTKLNKALDKLAASGLLFVARGGGRGVAARIWAPGQQEPQPKVSPVKRAPVRFLKKAPMSKAAPPPYVEKALKRSIEDELNEELDEVLIRLLLQRAKDLKLDIEAGLAFPPIARDD